MQSSKRRPHRLALATLAPRVFAFSHTFGLTVWIAVVESSGWTLILPGLLLLLWPGLAYVHATCSQNSKRAEFQNLLFDSLLFGFWCSVLDFYALATITILLACLMNNLVVGGMRQMLISASLFLVSALAGSVLTGSDFRPYVSTGLDVYQWAGAVVYFLTIGRVTYSQNRQIGQNIGEIKFRNRVFHALLDLGMIANRATSIHTLLNDSLGHLHNNFPEYGFAVYLQDHHSPEVTRYVAEVGLDTDSPDSLGNLLRGLNAQREETIKLEKNNANQHLYATSMVGLLSLYKGWLIIQAPKLNSTLERMLPLFVDQLAAATENKLLHLALKETAERDGLTGLYNRGFFESALAVSIQGKKQTPDLEFALLMIDVDGLKGINDQYGHVAGDKLITMVAKHLKHHCRDGDILARYGGDEFVILFPSAELSAANRLAYLIRAHLEDHHCTITTANGSTEKVQLRLSLGCASSTEAPAEEVLILADKRMYEDKNQRRTINNQY
jgi:diguanylate cyclase (GGDEF)-like protein